MEEKLITAVKQVDIVDNDNEKDEEALAAISSNPTVTWAKFILTDDQPNANKQRIPFETFASLIKTGLFMPIKMAEGKINDGHEEAKPIGAITHLKVIGNKIQGLAALWKRERPDDVASIKDKYSKGQPLELSWELLYSESSMDGDVENITDPIMKAITLVGKPAYEGRTPIIALASVWDTAYMNNLPDSAFLYVEPGGKKDKEGKTEPRSLRHFPYKDSSGKIDLAHLRNAIARIPQANIPANLKSKLQEKARKMLQNANASETLTEEESKILEEETKMDELEQLKQQFTELQEKYSALEAEHTAYKTELDDLRGYKASVEEVKASAEKLNSIKEKFTGAGISKDEDYFKTNSEMLLGLSSEALDFMLQELVAFSDASKKDVTSSKKDVPDIKNSNIGKPSVSDMAQYLKSKKEKK
jgi:hypothetical protein